MTMLVQGILSKAQNKLPDPSAVNNLAGDTASTSVDVASSVGDSAD